MPKIVEIIQRYVNSTLGVKILSILKKPDLFSLVRAEFIKRNKHQLIQTNSI